MRYLVLILLISIAASTSAEETPANTAMTQARLHDAIQALGTKLFASGNVVRFTFEGLELICISDVKADRMRIVTPIVELADIGVEQLALAMAANFHSALDARYAISEGYVYAAFIHPLSALSNFEIESAVHQVAAARRSFGGDYSSGAFFFGGEKQSTPKQQYQEI